MIMDAANLFSDAQDVKNNAASANQIDLGAANRDLGTGKPMYIVCVVDTALTNTGTVIVTLRQDSDSGMGSPTTIQTLFTIAAAAPIGTTYVAQINPGVITEQYIDVYYTESGSVDSANVTTFLTTDPQVYQAHADGLSW